MKNILFRNLHIIVGALFGLIGTTTQAQNFRPLPENMKFEYQDFEGTTRYKCSHSLENALSQDFLVDCHDELGAVKRRYRVHLWVTAYHRQISPKLSFEILYWLSDLSNNVVEGSGTTTWVNLKDAANLHSLYLSQSVDKNSAGLNLEILIP